jgi:phosphate transport system substrate-binding protein
MRTRLRSRLLTAAGLVLLLAGVAPAASAQEAPPAETTPPPEATEAPPAEDGAVSSQGEGAVSAQAVDADTKITGIGATFPANIYEQWKADVKKDPGLGFTVEYAAQGSGAGRTAYLNNTADFGASDVPLSAAEATQASEKRGGVVYVVTTSGGIAIGFNKAGLSNLQLTGEQLGKVFMGEFDEWGDLSTNNPSLAGDSTKIQPVVRSDSSGTSNAFTTYLSKASNGAWTRGTQNTMTKPANGSTGAGNDGVATAVKANAGAIGYMEVSFANERAIPVASVRNEAGNLRTPNSPNAVTDAVGDAIINEDRTVTMNYTTTVPNAYPISTVTYLLAPPRMDATKGDNLKAFLTYGVSAAGQAKAGPLGYAPLAPRLVALATEQIARINPQAAPQGTTTTTVAAGRVEDGAAAETTTTTAAPVTNTSTIANTSNVQSSTAARPRATTPARAAGATAAAPTPQNPGPLASTGGEQWMIALAGLLLIAAGEAGRRRLQRS